MSSDALILSLAFAGVFVGGMLTGLGLAIHTLARQALFQEHSNGNG